MQVVDDAGNILPRGTEGNIAIKCRPEYPVGLFSRYIVSIVTNSVVLRINVSPPAYTEMLVSIHLANFTSHTDMKARAFKCLRE